MSTEQPTTSLKEMDHITALQLRNSLLLYLERECEALGVYPTCYPVNLLANAATTKVPGAKLLGFGELKDELSAIYMTMNNVESNLNQQIIQSVVDDINHNGEIAQAIRGCV